MNKQELDQLRKNIADSPKGWTHTDCVKCFYIYNGEHEYSIWMDEAGGDPFWRLMPNNAIEFAGHIRSRIDIETIIEQADRIAEVEANQIPVENGANRYGVDTSYFRNVINRELNRGLSDFKPDELARVFARLSRTADASVLLESEFNCNQANRIAELEAFIIKQDNRIKMLESMIEHGVDFKDMDRDL